MSEEGRYRAVAECPTGIGLHARAVRDPPHEDDDHLSKQRNSTDRDHYGKHDLSGLDVTDAGGVAVTYAYSPFLCAERRT